MQVWEWLTERRHCMFLEEILKSDRDTLLLGAPLIILLFVGFFRLDELMLRPKKKQVPLVRTDKAVRGAQRFFSTEPDGTPLLPSHRPVKNHSK
jgi:hypothetical protein